MAQQALPGFRDFYPEQLTERAYVMHKWRDVVRRYAFVEYDGPPLEPLELYTTKSGEEIVTQLYNFQDKGGREVALRPEMTPTLARMVGARANALRKPARWFSIPQLFRYERQQKGRLREHFQLNVDIVGEGDVTADAELLACAVDVVRSFGLTGDEVVVRVSDRRILRGYLLSIGVPDERIADVYGIIDKLQRQPISISSEKLSALGLSQKTVDAVLSVNTVTIDAVRSAVAASTVVNTHTVQVVDDFVRYLCYVNALVPDGAAWVQFDMSIVRGLAYYTGIVFELFDRRGEFRAICGGGRYDNLLSTLSGVDLPALGFGMGDVVLSELLRARGLMPSAAPSVDYWIVTEGDVSVELAMQRAAQLRAEGHSVEFSLRQQTLSKQLKAAKSAGARETITVK